jgi:hypothetical protein
MAQSQFPPPPADRVCCGNCKHLAWLVALGQGIPCAQPDNRMESLANGGKDPPVIPGRYHWCDRFEWKDESRRMAALGSQPRPCA